MALDLWRTRPYMLSEAMDRLFDQALSSFPSAGRTDRADPGTVPVNVWETNEAFYGALLMPGVEEESIEATVHGDMLVVEGELRLQTPEGAKVIWQEFGPARFRRQLRLPASIDQTNVDASYKNGVLMVTLPKVQQARPRQIRIQAGSRDGK